MEFFVQVQGLVPLALRELGHGNPRPAGYDPRNLIIGDLLPDKRQILGPRLFLLLQLLLQGGHPAVAEFRRLLQVPFHLGNLNLAVHSVYFFA